MAKDVASRELRRLAGLAHERELVHELEIVGKAFDSWRGDGMSVWDLADIIHRFHDGTAREFYARYERTPPRLAAAAGFARGYLKDQDAKPEVKASLEQAIAALSDPTD